MMSNLYATIFWTEFQQKMKDDGIEVPEKLGVNATAYLRSLFIRDCDPRKAMLDDIRERINNLCEYKSFVRVEGDPVPTLPQIAKWCVIWILDEMEAEL